MFPLVPLHRSARIEQVGPRGDCSRWPQPAEEPTPLSGQPASCERYWREVKH
jgi:hypothetical protein